jgi:hypothetical protein
MLQLLPYLSIIKSFPHCSLPIHPPIINLNHPSLVLETFLLTLQSPISNLILNFLPNPIPIYPKIPQFKNAQIASLHLHHPRLLSPNPSNFYFYFPQVPNSPFPSPSRLKIKFPKAN